MKIERIERIEGGQAQPDDESDNSMTSKPRKPERRNRAAKRPPEQRHASPTKTEADKSNSVMARAAISPAYRHAAVSSAFTKPLFAENAGTQADVTDALVDRMLDTAKGDMRFVSNMLTGQAVSLDTIFTEMVRRAGANLGVYPDIAERYMRLALKAQAGSRTTLEALARLHRPREQVVKHVHVNDGGQAVVTDEFHHHGGGLNEKSAEQSHAQGPCSAALPRPDPQGFSLPVTGLEGKEAVPDARWHEPRPSEG